MQHTGAPTIKPFLFAWCVCLLVIELMGVGFANAGSTFDFSALYAAGYQVRTHPSQLYEPALQAKTQREYTPAKRYLAFYHPSYEALMYVPFSLLPYRWAYLALIAFNMLLLMATFWVAYPEFSISIPRLQPQPGLLLFWFAPLLLSLIFGQDSILLLLLCCFAWRKLKAGKDASAGVILALALFKFQFIIPIALLLTVKRGWRFAFGFLAASAGVVLLCTGIVGTAGIRALGRQLLSATTTLDKSAIVHSGMGLPSSMPSLAGLIYLSGSHFHLSSSIYSVLTASCSILVFTISAAAIRRCELKTAFSIAILCGLLVSYHFGVYDLTLALLPLLLLKGPVHRNLTATLFVLAIPLLAFATSYSALLAVLLLAMLINAIITAMKSPSIPEKLAKPSAGQGYLHPVP